MSAALSPDVESSDPLRAYIDAWNRNDPAAIVAAVTADAVIIESYGPVYRGAETVRRWADTWFAGGGRVHLWEITEVLAVGHRIVAQWRFTYHWDGEDRLLEGCSIARARDGRIAHLREYATTASLYDWDGEWR